MRSACLATSALLLAITVAPALAQQLPRPGQGGQPPAPPSTQKGQPPAAQKGQPAPPPPQQQQQTGPAAPKPYKPVSVQLPAAASDPSLEAFRKEVAGIAEKKDRAGLARLVVAKGFFVESEGGKANPKKSGIDNLAGAIGLDAQDGSGWEALTAMVSEASTVADPRKKGVVCAPAGPTLDEKTFDEVLRTTGTDPGEWGYPTAAGLEVRSAAQASATVTEKLGLHLIRVYPDEQNASEEWMRIVTPSGKVGFVQASALNQLTSDQICYVKEGANWRIAGVVGGGGAQ